MYRHRKAFPQRERLLVEAWMASDSVPRQLTLLQEVTRRFPDYWPGWFLLGDKLFHAGVFLGHDWREIQNAFNRAVSLNPKLRPAWGHMWENSIGKDTVEIGRLVARRRTRWQSDTSSDPERARGRVLVLMQYAAARSSGIITPELRALIDTLARFNFERFKTFPGESEVAAWSPFLNTGFPAAQIELNRRTLQLGMEGALAAPQLRGIAWSWAVRGAWDSALATMKMALREKPLSGTDQEFTPLEDYGIAMLGFWLGAVEPAEAAGRRAPALAAIKRLEPGEWKTESLWNLAWLDGLAAFSRNNRAALEQARRDSRRSGHPLGSFLDRSLAAYARALGGDRSGAGRELAALQMCNVTRACGFRFGNNIATDRLAAATWLLEAGDSVQAASLLIWYESFQGGWDDSYNYVVAALAYLMRAQVEEAQGDAGSAREHYNQFLRRYDSPMPGQRHLVKEARAALIRLSGRNDPTAVR
jgi:hypothetical protein